MLTAVERAGIKAPSHCRSGECGYCHSRLVSGDVFVPESTDERRRADTVFGYIHPCVSYPLSDLTIELPARIEYNPATGKAPFPDVSEARPMHSGGPFFACLPHPASVEAGMPRFTFDRQACIVIGAGSGCAEACREAGRNGLEPSQGGTIMKLRALVVSDHESEYIWDYFDANVFAGTDVIVSCGDLKPEYLSFLVTMIPAPLLYVRGNHDERYRTRPPEGCIDLEKDSCVVKGVRFVGFGGCKSTKPAENQYTEQEMERASPTSYAALSFAGDASTCL